MPERRWVWLRRKHGKHIYFCDLLALTCLIFSNCSSSSRKKVKYMKETSTSGSPPYFLCSSTVSFPPENACLLICEKRFHGWEICNHMQYKWTWDWLYFTVVFAPCFWSALVCLWGKSRSWRHSRSSWSVPPAGLGRRWSVEGLVWGSQSSEQHHGSSWSKDPGQTRWLHDISLAWYDASKQHWYLLYCNVALTWSMAQGMRHCISFLLPKICGKELLKDGAAWMAGKLIFPEWIMNKHVKESEDSASDLGNNVI